MRITNISLIVLLLLTFLNKNIFTQTFNDSMGVAVLPSLKAGYHSADAADAADFGDFGFPAGFLFDFTFEVHMGKGWFLGMNYDFWKVQDEVSFYHLGKYKRKLTASDFSFTLKYRYFLKKAALSAGIGLGSSVFRDELDYPGYYSESVSMLNVNARLGFDYILTKNILLSLEASLHGMDEMKYDLGGGVSRSHSFFKFTAGAGYLLSLY